MSGNCDFPCRQVNQYVIQICKRNCTAVPTPSHIASVTLQTDRALILHTSIGNITCSDYQILTVTLPLLLLLLLTYLLTPWCRVLLKQLTGLQPVKKFPAFTEPEGSLPHSQVSATCLYPGPAQSSPYTHIPPPADPS